MNAVSTIVRSGTTRPRVSTITLATTHSSRTLITTSTRRTLLTVSMARRRLSANIGQYRLTAAPAPTHPAQRDFPSKTSPGTPPSLSRPRSRLSPTTWPPSPKVIRAQPEVVTWTGDICRTWWSQDTCSAGPITARLHR